MNLRGKFIRLVIASAVGSLLWAGCATSNRVVVRDSAGAALPVASYDTSTTLTGGAVDQNIIAAAPLDQLKRRPDTHPELRSGLWQSTYQNAPVPAPVVEAPVVDLPQQSAGPTADTDSLLKYNPEVINIAEATAQPGGVITEAAGAEIPRRWAKKREMRVTQPPVPVIEAPAPEQQIEIPPAPRSDALPPPAPLKNENEQGPLLKRLLVTNGK